MWWPLPLATDVGVTVTVLLSLFCNSVNSLPLVSSTTICACNCCCCCKFCWIFLTFSSIIILEKLLMREFSLSITDCSYIAWVFWGSGINIGCACCCCSVICCCCCWCWGGCSCDAADAGGGVGGVVASVLEEPDVDTLSLLLLTTVVVEIEFVSFVISVVLLSVMSVMLLEFGVASWDWASAVAATVGVRGVVASAGLGELLFSYKKERV